jgi:hypothetical protein
MNTATFNTNAISALSNSLTYAALVGAMLVSLSNLAKADNISAAQVSSLVSSSVISEAGRKVVAGELAQLPASATGNQLSEAGAVVVPNIQTQLQDKIQLMMNRQLQSETEFKITAR